jgi:hypothetical protein
MRATAQQLRVRRRGEGKHSGNGGTREKTL